MLPQIKSYNDPHTLIVREMNTPFSAMYRSSRKILNKEILVFTDIIKQIDLKDIYRTFH